MHSESVRPCQHDRCPCRPVCQIYGTELLLRLRGHILSIQTIHSIPTYCARSTLANSPPHTETQRDPSRPPDNVDCRPLTSAPSRYIAPHQRTVAGVTVTDLSLSVTRRTTPSSSAIYSYYSCCSPSLYKTVQLSNIESVVETLPACRTIGCQGSLQD
jgi:hypothetical protein